MHLDPQETCSERLLLVFKDKSYMRPTRPLHSSVFIRCRQVMDGLSTRLQPPVIPGLNAKGQRRVIDVSASGPNGLLIRLGGVGRDQYICYREPAPSYLTAPCVAEFPIFGIFITQIRPSSRPKSRVLPGGRQTFSRLSRFHHMLRSSFTCFSIPVLTSAA